MELKIIFHENCIIYIKFLKNKVSLRLIFLSKSFDYDIISVKITGNIEGEKSRCLSAKR